MLNLTPEQHDLLKEVLRATFDETDLPVAKMLDIAIITLECGYKEESMQMQADYLFESGL